MERHDLRDFAVADYCALMLLGFFCVSFVSAGSLLNGLAMAMVGVLLGQRLANEEIAALLGCTATNVADHRKRIMRKLDLHSVADLTRYAIREGLVDA